MGDRGALAYRVIRGVAVEVDIKEKPCPQQERGALCCSVLMD